MNTSFARDAESRTYQSENPFLSPAPIQVRATIKSGHAILLETTVPFNAAPVLGQDFEIDRLSPKEQIQLNAFSRRGYLYKIGSGKDDVPEIEIAVEATAPRSEVKLNSAKIPHTRRAAINGFLARELGSFAIAWEADPSSPLVIKKEPSGADPSAMTLSKGIQSLIACPMSAG